MVADWTKLLVASTRAERTRDSPHSTSGISRFVTPNLVPAGSARRNNEISSGSRGASSKECDYLLSLPPLPPPPLLLPGGIGLIPEARNPICVRWHGTAM